jgi:nucleoid-associated protein YgaU
MGLFDFVKEIGNKIFGDGDDAAAKLADYVKDDNPGVDNLTVDVSGDVATISGTAASAEAKEKAVLMVGNALGIAKVVADGLDAPTTEVEVVYYEIKKGDTLWAIAQAHLGNGAKYTEIFQANREVIKDPDKIFPGQKIRIPK